MLIANEEDELRDALTFTDSVIPERISADPEIVENGLARLVLSIIELIRRLLEKQAIRRMDAGNLSDEEIERLGNALMKLEEKMDELKRMFGLSDDDLNLKLGPVKTLGYFPPHMAIEQREPQGLVDILDKILDKGLVVAGDVKVSLANVELLTIQLRLVICSIDKAEAIGINWWRSDRFYSSDTRALADAREIDELKVRINELESQLNTRRKGR